MSFFEDDSTSVSPYDFTSFTMEEDIISDWQRIGVLSSAENSDSLMLIWINMLVRQFQAGCSCFCMQDC